MKQEKAGVRGRVVTAAVALGLIVAFTFPASAGDMEEYFKGKTITTIVGSSPGGGADFNARLFTRFAPRHFPGKPRFIVQNIPGADQLTGLQAGMRAKPDGLTAASLNSRWAIQSILGRDLGPFNIRTARIVGSPIAVSRSELFCSDRKVASSWDQVLSLKTPLTYGGGHGSRSGVGALLLEELGVPLKMIDGYGGVAEQAAAFDRGELTAYACNESTVPRLFPEWLSQKRLVPYFWWDKPSDPDYLKRMGVTQKVPYLFDLPGVNFPPDAKIVLDVSVKMFEFTRALVLPPGTPDDIYEQWVKSYAETTEDPELVAAALKGGYEIELGKAVDFRESLKSVDRLTPQGLALFKKLMVQ